MTTLSTAQAKLRELLPEGIDLVVRALKDLLYTNTDKYKDLLLLEGRYLDTNRQLLQGVTSNEDAQLEFNRIRKDLLHFIDSLQEEHLQSDGDRQSGGRPDLYNGEVMYRIPDQMTQGQEVKCVVRLAFDRTVLMEGLKEQPGDVLKDLRISDVMGVELLDSGSNAFTIRTVSDTVQFVEKDLFTEWLFYVTPLRAGTHPLLLKISVIEIRNGIERKRNVVLEETVEVLTTRPSAEKETGFTSAGYALRLAATPLPGAAAPSASALPEEMERMPAPSAAPDVDMMMQQEQAGEVLTPRGPAPAKPAKKHRSITARLTPVIGALVLVLVAVWALRLGLFTQKDAATSFPEEEVAEGGGQLEYETWNLDTMLQQQDVDSTGMEAVRQAIRLEPEAKKEILEFVVKNPDGDVAAFAKQKIDSIEHVTWDSISAVQDTAAIREFIKTFPEGQHAKDANRMLKRIEKVNIRQQEH